MVCEPASKFPNLVTGEGKSTASLAVYLEGIDEEAIEVISSIGTTKTSPGGAVSAMVTRFWSDMIEDQMWLCQLSK